MAAKPKACDPATVRFQALGLDLGLEELPAFSNGQTLAVRQFYCDLEPALVVAQRAGNKGRVKAIHATIANRRKDHPHKLSTKLARTSAAVFVGNVNPKAISQARMAKSVQNTGWGSFKAMLQSKACSRSARCTTSCACSGAGARPRAGRSA